MKKILLIILFCLTLPVFAFRALTNEEYEGILRSYGLNKKQIQQLEIAKEKN